MPTTAEQSNQTPIVTNDNAIQSSNTTSGYFLGRQPRSWEIVRAGTSATSMSTRPHLSSASQSTGGPPKPAEDPVVQILAARAEKDGSFKELLGAVAKSKATSHQLKDFESQLNEFRKISERGEVTEPPNSPNQASSSIDSPVVVSPTNPEPVTMPHGLPPRSTSSSPTDIPFSAPSAQEPPHSIEHPGQSQSVSVSRTNDTDHIAVTADSTSAVPINTSQPATSFSPVSDNAISARPGPTPSMSNGSVQLPRQLQGHRSDQTWRHTYHPAGVLPTTRPSTSQSATFNAPVTSSTSVTRSAHTASFPLVWNSHAHNTQHSAGIASGPVLVHSGQTGAPASHHGFGYGTPSLRNHSPAIATGMFTATGSSPLVQYLESIKTQVSPRNDIGAAGRNRINWLQHAIQHADDLYLFLHQLICMKSNRANELANLTLLQPFHWEGLCLLEWTLSLGSPLSPQAISIFSDFPVPLQELHATPWFQPLLLDAKAFLEGFAWRWGLLRIESLQRACPPPAREIFEKLGIYHSTLSQTIFIGFCYQIYPLYRTNPSTQPLNLFKQSQDFMFQRFRDQAVGRSGWQPLQSEIDDFAKGFYSIAQQYGTSTPTTVEPIERILGHPANVPGRSTIHLIRFLLGQRSIFADIHPRSMQTINNRHSRASVSSPTTRSTINSANSNTISPQFDPDVLFFPREGQNPPTLAQPDPNRLALHQVIWSDLEQSPDRQSVPRENFRMYLFLDRFLGEVKVINNDTSYESWSVTLPTDLSKSRVEELAPSEKQSFSKRRRFLRNSSVIIYLRCVQLTSSNPSMNESVFSSSATSWPQHIFVSINGTHLDFRRKGHHGKDLACDITYLLHEGSNDIEMSYHVATSEIGKTYALAFEICRSYDHAEAIKLPSSLDGQTSLDSTVRLLKRQSEDDDIVMSDPYISIDLIDPFTAKIFDKPVRGKNCFHRECFDLDAFLRSRLCRNKDGLVHLDEWHCPICRKDARPINLVVDEFLSQVKEKLFSDGMQNVKAILVTEDGKWQPKADSTDQESSKANDTHKQMGATNLVPNSGARDANLDGSPDPGVVIVDLVLDEE